MLQDPGFKQTDPTTLQNPYWTSICTASPRSTALCNTGNTQYCADSANGAPPSGAGWIFFGGQQWSQGPLIATVSQTFRGLAPCSFSVETNDILDPAITNAGSVAMTMAPKSAGSVASEQGQSADGTRPPPMFLRTETISRTR